MSREYWSYLEEPVIVRMKHGDYYQVIAEDPVEFGRYLAETPWGEVVVIWDDEIAEWDVDESRQTKRGGVTMLRETRMKKSSRSRTAANWGKVERYYIVRFDTYEYVLYIGSRYALVDELNKAASYLKQIASSEGNKVTQLTVHVGDDGESLYLFGVVLGTPTNPADFKEVRGRLKLDPFSL